MTDVTIRQIQDAYTKGLVTIEQIQEVHAKGVVAVAEIDYELRQWADELEVYNDRTT